MSDKVRILFLCSGNSCRSQMAEGWARHLLGDLIDPYSAGSEPHGLNSRAVQVMAEAGVDISTHESKSISALAGQLFDYVFTVCGEADETCPFYPARVKRIHHGFDDPPRVTKGWTDEQEIIKVYRRVRDEIRDSVMSLPQSIQITRVS